jgi:DNA-binding response OmpR family regulator
MPKPTQEPSRGRVLLLEPNAALRSAILTVLAAERYEAEAVDCLDDVLARAIAAQHTVALVAWQSMEGLLAEEHRHDLVELSRKLRLVLMVPRRWARLLEATDLPSSVAAMVAKPFEADELIEKLDLALAREVEPSVVSN